MERRHVFPRAIPPPLLRAPLIPGLDRRSRKLGRSKFSLPTNFLLERIGEKRRSAFPYVSLSFFLSSPSFPSSLFSSFHRIE